MKIADRIKDFRINSLNLLIETTIGEYFELSKDILDNNEFQRRRVKSSSTVYSLLKSDLKIGCVIPPIVLALAINVDTANEKEDSDLIKTIEDNKNKLIILDGLQRTFTIRDLVTELTESSDPQMSEIKSRKLRIEVYIGINKLGILYRMLTLNTGQTPMSSRHQIEIIYSDYINNSSIPGVRLIREIEGDTPSKLGEYKFNDIIEGFTSYLERDYLTIDRTDILDNIKSLEKLAVENQETNLFEEFLTSYHEFVQHITTLATDWEFPSEIKLSTLPFGRTALKIFNKSQAMTGFGSAIGKLLDFKAIGSVNEIRQKIVSISDPDIGNTLIKLNQKLDGIRIVAKKIGNDQRMFFHFLFREIFDPKSDGYMSLSQSIDEAFTQYERKTQ